MRSTKRCSSALHAAGSRCSSDLVLELTRLAERPTLDDLLDRIDKRRGGRVGPRQAAKDLAAERAAR